MSQNIAIGIDLGTTNSCVSICRNGKIEIIPNRNGKFITPSYVQFSKDGRRIIGDQAKNEAYTEPENTIFDAKRLIGRNFNDIEVQNDMKHWPFKVICSGKTTKIQVNVNGKSRDYYPEEISSIILKELKETAEAHFKTEVKDCVITVPAYFNDSQRVATIDAGKLAGLNVMRIINEPTAAAIAFTLNSKSDEEKNVFVYDLGGGTFDVSIVKIKGKSCKVLSTDGNTHLGGEDFDQNVMMYAIKEFIKDKKGVTIEKRRDLTRIRAVCEKAKIAISSAKEAKILVEALEIGEDLEILLTRNKFEELNNELFNSTKDTIEKCLKAAGLQKENIDEIVLVGGSTRIPKIRSIVEDFFGKELNKTINPDEAVAQGAAVLAELLQNDKSTEVEDVDFSDVTPMSLGTDVLGGLMSIIIPRNTTIPVKMIETYYPVSSNQTSVSVMVLEGEHKEYKYNNELGKFILKGFPAGPDTKFNVSFEVDCNGILKVDCIEPDSKIRDQIEISHDKGRLSDDDIKKLIEDNKKADQCRDDRNTVIGDKNKLYEYCTDMISVVKNKYKNKAYRSEIKDIKNKCEEMILWIDENPEISSKDLDEKYKEVESFCKDNLLYL